MVGAIMNNLGKLTIPLQEISHLGGRVKEARILMLGAAKVTGTQEVAFLGMNSSLTVRMRGEEVDGGVAEVDQIEVALEAEVDQIGEAFEVEVDQIGEAFKVEVDLIGVAFVVGVALIGVDLGAEGEGEEIKMMNGTTEMILAMASPAVGAVGQAVILVAGKLVMVVEVGVKVAVEKVSGRVGLQVVAHLK